MWHLLSHNGFFGEFLFYSFQLEMYGSKILNFKGEKNLDLGDSISEKAGISLLLSVTVLGSDHISHFQVARRQATYLTATGMVDYFTS